MNIAVVFAGGVGVRMNTSGVPKQFLTVYDKPIIVHTIEKFQYNNNIDAVVVACVESHIEYMWQLCSRYNLTKVKDIVVGGTTGQESIYHGLLAAKKVSDDDNDIVLIHDGVRPLINDKVINDNIECVKTHGNCITCAPCKETIALVDDDGAIKSTTDRTNSRLARAPQSFKIGEILSSHEKARAEGKNSIIDSCTMMSMYGYKLYTIECGSENIKITTPDDYFLFKAILESQQNSQAF